MRELYQLLVREIETQVQEYGAQKLIVDGRSSVEETVAEVEGLFAAALEEGPTATTAAERRQLLRHANRAIVSQYQAYFARPWAPGDARTTVRAFACECGRGGCEEQVELAITHFPKPPDATSAPVLAPRAQHSLVSTSSASAFQRNTGPRGHTHHDPIAAAVVSAPAGVRAHQRFSMMAKWGIYVYPSPT